MQKSWKLLIEELAERISGDIHRSGDDPLDGGETERLGRLFTLELDLRQGNLTAEEYDRELSKLMFVLLGNEGGYEIRKSVF